MAKKKARRQPKIKLIITAFLILILPLAVIALKTFQDNRSQAKLAQQIDTITEATPHSPQLTNSPVEELLRTNKNYVKAMSKNQGLRGPEPTPTLPGPSQPDGNLIGLVRSWGHDFGPDITLTNAQDAKIIEDRIYILLGRQIAVFTLEGEFLFKWELDIPLSTAFDLATDGQYLYTTSYHDAKVMKFDLEGNLVLQWGEKGSGPKQMNWPLYIDFDVDSGNLFISDTLNNRIQIFDRYGKHIGTIGTAGTQEGQMNFPQDIVVKDQKMYLIDTGNNQRLQIFKINGSFMKKLDINTPMRVAKREFDNSVIVTSYSGVEMYGADDNLERRLLRTGSELDEVDQSTPIVFGRSPELLFAVDRFTPAVKIFSFNLTQPTYVNATEMKISADGRQYTLKDWYKFAMGSAIEPFNTLAGFTSYKALAIRDELFFIFTTGLDWRGTALVKAKLQGTDTLVPTIIRVKNRVDENNEYLWYLEEDGAIDMDIFNNEHIVIPGVDPGIHDGWSGGNAYLYDHQTDMITKQRCLTGENQIGYCGENNHFFPNVVHSYTTAVANNVLFLGASEFQNLGGTGVTHASLYRSFDSGQTWQRFKEFTNEYRVYDLHAIHVSSSKDIRNDMYALIANVNKRLMISTGNKETVGATWNTVEPQITTKLRGTAIGNKYYHITEGGRSIKVYTFNSDGTHQTETKLFQTFVLPYPSENYLNILTASDKNLFIMSSGNYIYKGSLNGDSWQRVARVPSTSGVVLSLTYWPAMKKIVAVTKGPEAKIYFIDDVDSENQFIKN